jgi:hypothetical protein
VRRSHRVRARQFIAEALPRFCEAETVDTRTGHQKKRTGTFLFSFFDVFRISDGTRGWEPFCGNKTLCLERFVYSRPLAKATINNCRAGRAAKGANPLLCAKTKPHTGENFGEKLKDNPSPDFVVRSLYTREPFIASFSKHETCRRGDARKQKKETIFLTISFFVQFVNFEKVSLFLTQRKSHR